MQTFGTVCPACLEGRRKRIPLVGFGDCELFECATCGTQFLDPQPSDERLNEIYGADYYEPWAVETEQGVDAMKRATFEPLLDACDLERGNRLLDVGCATGSLLRLASERGVDVYGLDLNPDAIRVAAERLPNATLHAGSLGDEAFPGVLFDAVTMVDFIEHVREPGQELTRVRSSMAPNARLVISTPRADSSLRRVMRAHWPQYREEHLTYFSTRGIRTLLGRCGFDVVDVRPTHKVITLAYAHGQMVAYPVAGLDRLTKVAYDVLGPLRHSKVRVRLGEMTVVAACATTGETATPGAVPPPSR